jgi:anti-anti-sigma factor
MTKERAVSIGPQGRRLIAGDQQKTTSDDVSASLASVDGALKVTITQRSPASEEQTATIVDIEGDIDYDSAPLMVDALSWALDSKSLVYCDLSQVTFFGASGANALLAADHHARALGRRLLVRGVRGMTRRVIRFAQLEPLVVENLTSPGMPRTFG